MTLRELKDVMYNVVEVNEIVIQGELGDGVDFYYSFKNTNQRDVLGSFKRDENFDDYEVKQVEFWNHKRLEKVTLEITLSKGE